MTLSPKKTYYPANPLIRALIISGALNVSLLACFAYSWFRERPPIPYYVLKPAEETQNVLATNEQSNSKVIADFKKMSLEQLTSKLNNNQLIENGYTQRDLALGCLVTFHHFNLSRALIGLPPAQQQRILTPEKIVVYPGLEEKHFEAIIRYVQTERWPYTSQGLFLMLQQKNFQNEPSLEEAFFLTPEFMIVETLFSRGESPIEKKELLHLLIEGCWNTLNAFAEQQKMSQDLSPTNRQRFLLSRLQEGSQTAALIIIRTDLDFAIKKLDDPTVMTLLKMLNKKTAQAQKFSLEMLTSPRSDAVWQQAALRLYEFAGEPPPQTYDRGTALAKFGRQQAKEKIEPQPVQKQIAIPAKKPMIQTQAPQMIVKKTINPNTLKTKPFIAVKKDRLYLVQEGDSLWKISKRFQIDVDLLKKHNRLTSDALKPGTPLRIPS